MTYLKVHIHADMLCASLNDRRGRFIKHCASANNADYRTIFKYSSQNTKPPPIPIKNISLWTASENKTRSDFAKRVRKDAMLASHAVTKIHP